VFKKPRTKVSNSVDVKFVFGAEAKLVKILVTILLV